MEDNLKKYLDKKKRPKGHICIECGSYRTYVRIGSREVVCQKCGNIFDLKKVKRRVEESPPPNGE